MDDVDQMDLAALVSEVKDIVCQRARESLWYHRVEEACRDHPRLSWCMVPWLRLKIWWYYSRNCWYVRKGLRLLDHSDPEWAQAARVRFREELGRPVERTSDGSIVVAKGLELRLEIKEES